jgi:hypothetical protein
LEEADIEVVVRGTSTRETSGQDGAGITEETGSVFMEVLQELLTTGIGRQFRDREGHYGNGQMVTDKKTDSLSSVTTALRGWINGLSSDTAVLHEEESEFEIVFRITPTNSRGCPVEFRFSGYGTFGLYIGKALSIEELPCSVDYVLDICESVRRGRVKQELWEWRGKLIRAKGEVVLSENRIYDQGSYHWLACLPIGRHRVVQCEPWEENRDGQNIR